MFRSAIAATYSTTLISSAMPHSIRTSKARLCGSSGPRRSPRTIGDECSILTTSYLFVHLLGLRNCYFDQTEQVHNLLRLVPLSSSHALSMSSFSLLYWHNSSRALQTQATSPSRYPMLPQTRGYPEASDRCACRAEHGRHSQIGRAHV